MRYAARSRSSNTSTSASATVCIISCEEKSKKGVIRYNHRMIEEIRSQTREEQDNPTLNFVHMRMSASRPAERKVVAELLENRDGLSHAFFSLVENLKDGRKQYTLKELAERDTRAEVYANQYAPTEAAARRQVLRREDEGIPSALELFFTMILSDEEWTRLCRTKEGADVLGKLTARNAIEAALADEPRTKKFIRAVQHESRKFGESTFVVYDVGSGPFPILGLSAALSSPQAKVTCIESNPLSANIARAIVSKFVESGAIAADQIVIKEGDPLN